MDPAVIGGIIAAGGAVASSVINKAGTMHKGRRRLNRQKELASYNQQLQNETYEKYQSPAAMMRQYQEAGLNPNLAYQNASAGGPGVAQVDSSAADFDDNEAKAQTSAEAVNSLANGFSAYYELKSKQISNSNAELAGAIAGEDLKTRKQLNEFNAVANKYKIEELADEVIHKKLLLSVDQQTKLDQAKLSIEESKERIKASKAGRKAKKREMAHLDKMDEEIDTLIKLNREKANEIRQTIQFGYDYHPYKLRKLKIDNALSSQAYKHNAAMLPYQLEALENQTIKGYYDAMSAASTAGLKQKDLDSYDFIQQLKSDNLRWQGPNLWNLPGIFLKTLDRELTNLIY